MLMEGRVRLVFWYKATRYMDVNQVVNGIDEMAHKRNPARFPYCIENYYSIVCISLECMYLL